MFGVRFDIRSNLDDLKKDVTDLQKKHLPKAQVAAATRTGAYVFAALRSEMEEVFEDPTDFTLKGLRYRKATTDRPVVSIWLEEFSGKGIAPATYLRPQIQGGTRRHKRFERALIERGLMSPLAFAVPGRQAPLDANGNVPGSFIVRVLSDLKAFGEQGYRANRRGKRTGRRKTNYFFVPRPGSTLKPGVYWHMPNKMLGVVFAFVSRPAYEKKYDFYGVGERAYQRVATRFMTEALQQLIRKDNR